MDPDIDRHSIAGAIKEVMARRRVSLRQLSEATELPYRTVQNYLRETSPIPARALARIAKALDVSADWLLFGREPNIDREALKVLLGSFDRLIKPQITASGLDAAADVFLSLYEFVYLHHYTLPDVPISLDPAKAFPNPDHGKDGEGGSQ